MNGSMLCVDFSLPGASRPVRLFRWALALSLAFHFAALLTSPFWQARTKTGDVLSVELAPIPEAELPKIEDLPAARPIALPAAPPARRAGKRDAPAPPEGPGEAAGREAIRQKIASRGLLPMLAGAEGEVLPRIDIPRAARAARPTNSVPSAGGAGWQAEEKALAERAGRAGIGRPATASASAAKAQASRVFTTDSGLSAEIIGGMDDRERSEGAIADTIRRYQSGIRYAYNKELLANPNISGRITVTFVIRPDGSVESAEVRQSTVGWPPLEEAVVRRMLHWRFARSAGAPVRVTFPFVFHPQM